MRTFTRALNLLLLAFDVVGHAAVGVFFTSTRLMGVHESPWKLWLIIGHLSAWPLFGMAQALLGGFHRFAGSLLRPHTARGAWRLLFTFIGARWIVQETLRRLHPQAPPPELLSRRVQDADLTAEVLRHEGLDRGVKGLLRAANRIYALQVTTHELRLPRLPAEFDGFTIVQLSDVHYADFISAEFIRRYVAMTLDISPDFIAFTGDYQTFTKDVLGAAEILAPVGEWSRRERCGKGTAAVMGNHDREAGVYNVEQALTSVGISVLDNEHIRLERGGASLYIAGVADPWSYRADLDIALDGVPEGACTIVLAHVPDFFDRSAGPRVDLQLSGHNHGGQVTAPLLGPVLVSSRYNRRYAGGLYRRNGSLMYVSNGLGGKPPIRWGARPEVARIVLRAS